MNEAKNIQETTKKAWSIGVVMHRYFTKCEQFYWIPTFTYTGAGYPKPKKGIMVMWLGWCKQLRKPINERW
jgi:hypothetical protein